MYPLSFVICAVLFFSQVSPANAESWDSRIAALYGDAVSPVKIKTVATDVSLSGDVLDEDPEKARDLMKKLRTTLHNIAQEMIKPEFKLDLCMQVPRKSVEQLHSLMILNIDLVIKNGKKFNPPVATSMAVALPVFGRPNIAIAYPYYNFDPPVMFAISENEQETLKNFEEAVRPMITHGLQGVVCVNSKNKGHSFCKTTDDRYTGGIFPKKN